jgi:adenine-specific DNA-methyltransferase
MERGDATRRARELRRAETEPESMLWARLRGRRAGDLKFRRQAPIGPYFVDFCCVAAGVVVELDGDQHAASVPYDDARTRWLEHRGWSVLRWRSTEVLADLEAVVSAIVGVCFDRLGRPEAEGEDAPSSGASRHLLPRAGEGTEVRAGEAPSSDASRHRLPQAGEGTEGRGSPT